MATRYAIVDDHGRAWAGRRFMPSCFAWSFAPHELPRRLRDTELVRPHTGEAGYYRPGESEPVYHVRPVTGWTRRPTRPLGASSGSTHTPARAEASKPLGVPSGQPWARDWR
ncbi:MAG: hypothetical protein JXR96_04925 [Deltaproteobacteria bacterium]|nr:hypothetical protein [Deltaproteobacteria bacterium]